jgi:hypothetical protein
VIVCGLCAATLLPLAGESAGLSPATGSNTASALTKGVISAVPTPTTAILVLFQIGGQ